MAETLKWPTWLLTEEKTKAFAQHPNAMFNPASAAANIATAFLPMTSPASEIKTKVLIIDRNVFYGCDHPFSYQETLAFISTLADNGIEIYLCCSDEAGDSIFVKVNGESPCKLAMIERLSVFNPRVDHERLASQQMISFEQSVYLDSKKQEDLVNETLNHYQWYAIGDYSNRLESTTILDISNLQNDCTTFRYLKTIHLLDIDRGTDAFFHEILNQLTLFSGLMPYHSMYHTRALFASFTQKYPELSKNYVTKVLELILKADANDYFLSAQLAIHSLHPEFKSLVNGETAAPETSAKNRPEILLKLAVNPEHATRIFNRHKNENTRPHLRDVFYLALCAETQTACLSILELLSIWKFQNKETFVFPICCWLTEIGSGPKNSRFDQQKKCNEILLDNIKTIIYYMLEHVKRNDNDDDSMAIRYFLCSIITEDYFNLTQEHNALFTVWLECNKVLTEEDMNNLASMIKLKPAYLEQYLILKQKKGFYQHKNHAADKISELLSWLHQANQLILNGGVLTEFHENEYYAICEACLTYGSASQKLWLIQQMLHYGTVKQKFFSLALKSEELRPHFRTWMPLFIEHLSENDLDLIICQCIPDDVEWLFQNYSEIITKILTNRSSCHTIDTYSINSLMLRAKFAYSSHKGYNVCTMSIPTQNARLLLLSNDDLFYNTRNKYSELLTVLNTGGLSDLVALEIYPSNKNSLSPEHQEKLLDLLRLIKTKCPKLQLLTLPPSMIDTALEVGLSFRVAPACETQITSLADYRSLQLNERQQSQPGMPPQTSNKLFLCNSSNSGVSLAPQTNPTFQLEEGGEIITPNVQPLPRVRVAHFSIDDQLRKNYKQTAHLNPIEAPLHSNLAMQDLLDYASRHKEDVVAKFIVQLPPGKTVRLLSLTADDKLLTTNLNDAKSVAFFKGDDGFIYAKATMQTQLEYAVQTPKTSLQLTVLDRLPPEIVAIVTEYKNAAHYHETAIKATLPPRENKTTSEWLNEWYEQRAGVCEHRCLAVYHRIVTKYPKHLNNVRMVNIDNNHARLEVRNIDNKWQQLDFGGGPANFNYVSNKNGFVVASSESATFAPKEEPRAQVEPHSRIAEPTRRPQLTDHSTVIELPKSINLALRALFAVADLPSVKSNDDLLQQINSPTTKHQRVLIQSANIWQQQIAIIQDATTQGETVFCINSSADLDNGKKFIDLSDSQNIKLVNDGPLKRFLTFAQQNPQKKTKLLINWSAFSNQEKVALNTLLDIKRTICGMALAENVQVIGLTESKPSDSSFISRHDLAVKATYSLARNTPASPQPQEKILIDLEGAPNWHEALFGPVICTQNRLKWLESEFVQHLKNVDSYTSNPIYIELRNAPPEAHNELKQYVQQAKAQGYFVYHHQPIRIPSQFQIQLSDSPLDFTPFRDQGHRVITEMTDAHLSHEQHIVNTHLFDYLLASQCVDEAKGEYTRTPGLIAQAAMQRARDNQTATLQLHITSHLSISQWYCLFAETKKHKVKLSLFLAPNVKLPQECFLYSEKTSNPALSTPARRGATIIETNDPQQAVNDYLEISSAIIIDVEDYGFYDFIGHIGVTNPEGEQFERFQFFQSQLLDALKDGRHVVLKGEFSAMVLHGLQPLIADCSRYEINGQSVALRGQLTIIADMKANNDFSWHNPERLEKRVYSQQLPKAEPLMINEPDPARWGETPPSASQSLIDAKTFIDERIARLQNVFSQPGKDGAPPPTMVQLIGPSGVGKSHLLEELAKAKPDEVQVFHEFANIDAWANHSADGSQEKERYLFIDENNIEDKHLTMFAALARRDKDGKCQFLYNGNLYQLGTQHKIVFACNPVSFGGGRVQQKLFSNVAIPEIHCKDFPDSYIYEQLLKPIYKAASISNLVSEETFLNDCAVLLKHYHSTDKMTVRELQAWALNYCARQQLKGPLTKTDWPKITNQTNYVEINATSHARVALAMALKVNEQQRSNQITVNGSGLNAVLIEGSPGLGKSEMIHYLLSQRGYQAYDPKIPHNENVYRKLDASLSLAEKKKMIIEAFDSGHVVWIDEINSCIDEGLEKILNAALTGFHPDSKQRAQKSGFQLLATANSAGMEGRSIIGSALRHRSVQITLPKPDVESLNQLLLKLLTIDQQQQVDVRQMASSLFKLMQEDSKINLRSIRKKLPELVTIFDKAHMQVSNKAIDNTNNIELKDGHDILSETRNIQPNDQETLNNLRDPNSETIINPLTYVERFSRWFADLGWVAKTVLSVITVGIIPLIYQWQILQNKEFVGWFADLGWAAKTVLSVISVGIIPLIYQWQIRQNKEDEIYDKPTVENDNEFLKVANTHHETYNPPLFKSPLQNASNLQTEAQNDSQHRPR